MKTPQSSLTMMTEAEDQVMTWSPAAAPVLLGQGVTLIMVVKTLLHKVGKAFFYRLPE